MQVLEGMRGDIAHTVLAATSRTVGERAWRLPRRLHTLDEAVSAVRHHTAFIHFVPVSLIAYSCSFRQEVLAAR